MIAWKTCCFGVILLLGLGCAQAAVLTVAAGDEAGLMAAIARANATEQVDEIHIVASNDAVFVFDQTPDDPAPLDIRHALRIVNAAGHVLHFQRADAPLFVVQNSAHLSLHGPFEIHALAPAACLAVLIKKGGSMDLHKVKFARHAACAHSAAVQVQPRP